ncbi:F0F1 ATP synthase subunit B [Enterococcus lemanii]|uniref:ATP synthase subunit b n=1 Tax=Enterococcus lemanii TaxID=1159752 RepID=A0ABV9MXI2_9ENTE|nr:F0F1 ATP synthase subunit B [Enterococcus lemanii]MBM7708376.1 F-type H+-transporting ATPase subunit b [Enterococcus lemanii]NLM67925.1 F0F1 ATP synthase subunit B [Enterococcus sp.]
MLNHLVLLNASPNTTISSFLVVTVSFVLLLALIKHFAWEQISEVFKKREDQISNDLDSAEQAKINAQKYEKEIEKRFEHSEDEANLIIQEAKKEGESNRQTLLSQTQEEVERLKEKAHQDINFERQTAMAAAKKEIADLSIAIAEKILTSDLSLEHQEMLVDQYIEQLGSEHEA